MLQPVTAKKLKRSSSFVQADGLVFRHSKLAEVHPCGLWGQCLGSVKARPRMLMTLPENTRHSQLSVTSCGREHTNYERTKYNIIATGNGRNKKNSGTIIPIKIPHFPGRPRPHLTGHSSLRRLFTRFIISSSGLCTLLYACFVRCV